MTTSPPLDVAALAAAQMRAARAAYDARLAWERARAAWLGAGHTWSDQMPAELAALAHTHHDTARASHEADRAYQAACDDLLAETLEQSAPTEQPGLF